MATTRVNRSGRRLFLGLVLTHIVPNPGKPHGFPSHTRSVITALIRSMTLCASGCSIPSASATSVMNSSASATEDDALLCL